MPLLNMPLIILLVTFMSYVHPQEIGNGINRCLTVDRHGDCSCCKSGFRGQTCNDICEHCLSRIGTGQSCTYYCQTGFCGTTCDKPCPTTCAPGINGQPLCTENNGLPVCVRCGPRSYGKQCNQTCETNCLKRTCRQADGKCFSCIGKKFYGDHCTLPCSKGCNSGRCDRTGRCTHGCKYGSHGERCESLCRTNCKQGRCTSHGYHPYNCTEGCNGGYWGTRCLDECQNHCMKCEQQSGRCTLCVENYILEPETRECIEVAEGSNLVIIVVAVIVVIVVIIIAAIIIMVIWKKRRPREGEVKKTAREKDEQQKNGQHERKPMLPTKETSSQQKR